MNKAKIIKHLMLVLFGFLAAFTVLYLWLKGQSGGDIALVVICVIFLIVYTLSIGLVTYSWDFKEKIGVISGLVTSYISAYILFKLFAF